MYTHFIRISMSAVAALFLFSVQVEKAHAMVVHETTLYAFVTPCEATGQYCDDDEAPSPPNTTPTPSPEPSPSPAPEPPVQQAPPTTSSPKRSAPKTFPAPRPTPTSVSKSAPAPPSTPAVSARQKIVRPTPVKPAVSPAHKAAPKQDLPSAGMGMNIALFLLVLSSSVTIASWKIAHF